MLEITLDCKKLIIALDINIMALDTVANIPKDVTIIVGDSISRLQYRN